MPHFDGETYIASRDHSRLNSQLNKVFNYMNDHGWHSLDEIAQAVGCPQASVSARLRDLRKSKFGGYTIDRTYIDNGLYHYRLVG